MGQPVVHFEIIGKDAAALQRFYGELFGWTVNTDNPMHYGTIDPSDAGIGGGIAGGPDDQYPGHVTFYMGVEDAEAALAQAEALGGSRVMGPEQVAEGLVIGLFRDPEGHMLGVVQQG